MDFPYVKAHRSSIGVHSRESIGIQLKVHGGASLNSTAFVANVCYYVPFTLVANFNWKTVYWINGATITANVDAGVYTLGGAKVATTGSTAQAGANALQQVNLGTPILLSPGQYYLAVAGSAATGALLMGATSARLNRAFGMLQQTATFPLPASATFATQTQTTLPWVGISEKTLV
jgi:hypothetical protein